MLFFILCIYVSFYYIRPFEWSSGLNGIPIFLFLGIISIISLLIVWVSGKIRLFRYKTDIMVIGFTIAIAFSHLRVGYVWGAINSVADFLPSVICYFLVVYALNTEKKLLNFLILIVILSLFLSYESCMQSITGFSHGGMAPYIQDSYGLNGDLIQSFRARWFGPFNDPNDLGLVMILGCPFLVNMLFNKRYLIGSTCLVFLSYGLYLTNSRGAMLAFMISVMVYLVLRYRSVKGVAFSLVIVLLVIFWGPSRVTQISGADESAYGRIEAWYQGFQMFKSSPLFGIGKGMFSEYHKLTAHNSFMLVLSELGVFGSFFFVGIFFYPLYWAKSLLWNYDESAEGERRRYILAAGVATLIGLMVSMFFLSRSYIMVVFMVIGIITVIINRFYEQSDKMLRIMQFEGYHIIMIGGLVILQIIFINIMVKFFI
jgi:putative inorganic carbon (hco3(-)) transporter